MKRFQTTCLLLLCVLALTSCSVFRDFDFEQDPEPTMDAGFDVDEVVADVSADTADSSYECMACVAELIVEPSFLSLEVGESQRLTWRALDEDGNAARPTASVWWRTDDESVATVSGTGEVIARGPGSTTVRATLHGQTATVDVEVVAPSETRVVIVPSQTVDLAPGETFELTARKYENEEEVPCLFTWSSDDENVATVDSSGIVTGIADGMTTVRATCEEDAASVQVRVAGLASPLTDPTRLMAWFESDSGITLNQDNRVVRWDGKSENGEAFVNIGDVPPAFVTMALGDKPSLAFDGAQDMRTPGDYATREQFVTEEFTVFFIARNNDVNHRGQLLSNCADEGSNMQIRYNGAAELLYVFGFGTDVDTSLNLAAPTTTFQLITVRRWAMALEVYQNGMMTDSTFTDGNGNFHFSQIGARCVNEYLRGELVAILLYGEALSDSDRLAVRDYLERKYDL